MLCIDAPSSGLCWMNSARMAVVQQASKRFPVIVVPLHRLFEHGLLKRFIGHFPLLVQCSNGTERTRVRSNAVVQGEDWEIGLVTKDIKTVEVVSTTPTTLSSRSSKAAQLSHDDIVRFLSLNEEKATSTKLKTVALRNGINHCLTLPRAALARRCICIM